MNEILLALGLVQLAGPEFRVVVEDQFVLRVAEHIKEALTQRFVQILNHPLVAPTSND